MLRTVSLAHLGRKISFFSLDVPNRLCSAQKLKILQAHCENQKFSTEKPWKNHQHQGEMMTDIFPAGKTRYPGRNAEEKTILHLINYYIMKSYRILNDVLLIQLDSCR